MDRASTLRSAAVAALGREDRDTAFVKLAKSPPGATAALAFLDSEMVSLSWNFRRNRAFPIFPSDLDRAREGSPSIMAVNVLRVLLPPRVTLRDEALFPRPIDRERSVFMGEAGSTGRDRPRLVRAEEGTGV